MTTKGGKTKPLNPKQELFAKLYASDREFFGNGVQSYIEAYNFSGSYNVAVAASSRLLSDVRVLARIDEYLESMVFNDQHMDKQLGFWATQKAAPNAAVQAVREYNKLKGRIVDHTDLTSGGERIQFVVARGSSDTAAKTQASSS